MKEESMEEYAKSREKKSKSKIRSVTVKKAQGGYIVEVHNDDYGMPQQLVYKDLDGVSECLEKKFGG